MFSSNKTITHHFTSPCFLNFSLFSLKAGDFLLHWCHEFHLHPGAARLQGPPCRKILGIIPKSWKQHEKNHHILDIYIYIYYIIHTWETLIKKNHGIWFLLLFRHKFLVKGLSKSKLTAEDRYPFNYLLPGWSTLAANFQGYSHVVKRNDNTLSQTHQDLKCQVGLFGWAFTHIMGSFGLSNTFLCMFSPSRCDGWSRSCDQPGARCWRDRDQRPVPWSAVFPLIAWETLCAPSSNQPSGTDAAHRPSWTRSCLFAALEKSPWPPNLLLLPCLELHRFHAQLLQLLLARYLMYHLLPMLIKPPFRTLALRTTDMLESIGFNSQDALTEAETILWSGLPDLTAADIQALKTRRLDRSAAAAEMATEWDWRGVAIRSSQFFWTYSSFFFSGMQF